MSKVRINLFGEMWKLIKINVNYDVYLALKKRTVEIGESWPTGLLSANFFDADQFVNCMSYENLEHTCHAGLMNTYKNQIEIWHEGKKIRKLKIGDLNNDLLLFPLYQLTKNVLNYETLESGIYIEQYEIGIVGCYEGEVTDFKLGHLVFNSTAIQKKEGFFEVLHSIGYRMGDLKFNARKIDTLITKQICFEI